MNTFSDVIDAFGREGASGDRGRHRAADVMGIPDSHVRTLKARDNIPPDYFKRLVDGAQSLGVQGVTYDLLYRLREEQLAKRSSPAEAAA